MNTFIKIADANEELELDYQQALAFHEGNSIWGVTVAFRMLQLAGNFFNNNKIWNRNDLFIISGHPGPGVKDAIEFVTHCISNNRFQLQAGCEDKGCSRNMKFEWLITHGKESCTIKLRGDFVPAEFYDCLDRLNTDQEQNTDKELFKKFKQELSDNIWQERLQDVFWIEMNPMNVGNNAHA